MIPEIDFNTKTVLITGGAGFNGSNLAFYFQNNFPKSKVVIFDCFRSHETFPNNNLKSFGHFNNLIGFKGEIICGDIVNPDDLQMLKQYKFDFIFHHAAISDTRVYDQNIIMRTNVNAFISILNIAKKDNAKVVYASSAATYGNLPSPQTVGIENPENPYGFSKLLMEQVAHRFSIKNPGMSLIGLRFFNVYGPREYFKAKTASMIIQLGHQILNNQPPRLFENSSQIFRDFVYIEDVIQANIKACLAEKNGVFNVGTGIARSFLEITKILQEELHIKMPIEYFPNPYENYQVHTQADISKSKKDLGFEPEFSLEQGIKAYIPKIIQFHGSDNT